MNLLGFFMHTQVFKGKSKQKLFSVEMKIKKEHNKGGCLNVCCFPFLLVCCVLCFLKFSEGGTFISEIRKKCGQQLTKYMPLCFTFCSDLTACIKCKPV